MSAFMKSVGEIARCAALYREAKLKHLEIGRYQHTYILTICRNPGISQEQLSKLIYVNKSNVARQLANLEATGIVERRENSEDKRILSVFPTQKAIDLYPIIQTVLSDWNQELLCDLTDSEKEFLSQAVEKVAQKAKQKTQNIL
jgi:Transcriptional regulators